MPTQNLGPDLAPYLKSALEWSRIITSLSALTTGVYYIFFSGDSFQHLLGACMGTMPLNPLYFMPLVFIPVGFVLGRLAYVSEARTAINANHLLQEATPIPMTCTVAWIEDIVEARLTTWPEACTRMPGWQQHPTLAPLATEVAGTWDSFRDTLDHIRAVYSAWIAEISLPDAPELPPLAFVVIEPPGQSYKWRRFRGEVQVYIGPEAPRLVVIRTPQGILIRKL